MYFFIEFDRLLAEIEMKELKKTSSKYSDKDVKVNKKSDDDDEFTKG